MKSIEISYLYLLARFEYKNLSMMYVWIVVELRSVSLFQYKYTSNPQIVARPSVGHR